MKNILFCMLIDSIWFWICIKYKGRRRWPKKWNSTFCNFFCFFFANNFLVSEVTVVDPCIEYLIFPKWYGDYYLYWGSKNLFFEVKKLYQVQHFGKILILAFTELQLCSSPIDFFHSARVMGYYFTYWNIQKLVIVPSLNLGLFFRKQIHEIACI